MIITRLHGRLGNQMFQYAAGRALADRAGVPLALDSRGAILRGEGVLTRVFDLELADPVHLPPLKQTNPLRYAIWRGIGQKVGAKPYFRRERGLGYNPAFEDWGDNSYLHGYWQSQKYFQNSAERIRSDFTFPAFSNQQNAEMAARIAESTAISLHVRRGDYLTFAAHVLCDQAYYDAALAKVLDGLQGDPIVYVFSDDPQWAKDNLSLPCEKVVVDFNGPETDFEDMRLMSLCQHNIIGNSSFSWWAAWLNQTPGRRVAGPAKWFGDPKLSNPDIFPHDWLRISV
ncbi:alpha-1,2-fucosyltransferase [Phaeobacter italicus]|uniref:alpha-1,2-fucosyltransferase n=1 Tax=Phaeobacter italicus TaxID=481446 RepID=UPI00018704C5|nr:alpha-1,2-fucosyltransferase [Phaeobacter italicus]EEB72648.1 putative fucosyl transferase [Ruegeria sp. R11]CRL16306.1 Glycosyl transferase family 11 [Phaeobacter italicus]SFH13760.1 Glycosyl transferase family 11 [Phaeobacter italicus]